MLSRLSCVPLRDPMDCSPPGSSVHGFLQARITRVIGITSPGDLPDLGIKPTSLMSLTLTPPFLYFFKKFRITLRIHVIILSYSDYQV